MLEKKSVLDKTSIFQEHYKIKAGVVDNFEILQLQGSQFKPDLVHVLPLLSAPSSFLLCKWVGCDKLVNVYVCVRMGKAVTEDGKNE